MAWEKAVQICYDQILSPVWLRLEYTRGEMGSLRVGIIDQVIFGWCLQCLLVRAPILNLSLIKDKKGNRSGEIQVQSLRSIITRHTPHLSGQPWSAECFFSEYPKYPNFSARIKKREKEKDKEKKRNRVFGEKGSEKEN